MTSRMMPPPRPPAMPRTGPPTLPTCLRAASRLPDTAKAKTPTRPAVSRSGSTLITVSRPLIPPPHTNHQRACDRRSAAQQREWPPVHTFSSTTFPERPRTLGCAGATTSATMTPPKGRLVFSQSAKLAHVLYDIRGPVLEEADRMEAAGNRILKLNIGNPAPFGFEAPDAILVDMIKHLPEAQGYSDSRGIPSARRAVVQYYETKGIRNLDADDVYLGNG